MSRQQNRARTAFVGIIGSLLGLAIVTSEVLSQVIVSGTGQSTSVLDPSAPSAASDYQSAFIGYKPLQSDALIDWRKANDIVREVGGHAGALKNDAAAEMPAHSMKNSVPIVPADSAVSGK